MKALVYHGPGKKSWDEVPDPTLIDATDAIVQVDTTTICGTDLHILKGDVPAVTEGRILGHEGVGTVLEVGSSVRNRRRRRPRHHLVRQLVRRLHLLPQRQPVALPRRRGRLRHRLDPRSPDRRHPGRAWCGSRSPTTPSTCCPSRCPDEAADAAVRHLPDRLRDRCAVRAGQARRHRRRRRRRPGRPGRHRHCRALRRRPDHRDRPRREPARAGQAGRRHALRQLRCGRLEGAGVRADRRLWRRRRGRGRRRAGDVRHVHATWCAPVATWPTSACTARRSQLDLQTLWIQNINISMGLVNTTTLGMLLKLVAQQKLPVDKFVTHRFALDDILVGVRDVRQRGARPRRSRCSSAAGRFRACPATSRSRR